MQLLQPRTASAAPCPVLLRRRGPPRPVLLPRAATATAAAAAAKPITKTRRPRHVAAAAAAADTNAPSALPACPVCAGAGRVPCPDCAGAGVLGRGGYVRRNPLPKKLVGSKWTAAGSEPVLGWRHFVVEETRRAGGAEGGGGGGGSTSSSSGGDGPPQTHAATAPQTGNGALFARLKASCDPSARLWVSAQLLRDRSRWAAGWLRMDDVVLVRQQHQEEEVGEEEQQQEEQQEDQEHQEEQQEQEEARGHRKKKKARRRGDGNAKASSKIVVRGSGLGVACRRCEGTGWRPCTACKGEGRAELIVL